jgi:MFS family permease
MRLNRPGYLAFIKLAPGVTPVQALVLIVVALIGDAFYVLIPAAQPYVLQNQIHADPATFGQITGLFQTTQNIAMLVSIAFLGALADRIWRKPLMIGGLAAAALGSVLYPFVTTISAAVALNFLIGLGTSGYFAAVGACVFDYPDNASRGSLVATLVVTQRLFASFMAAIFGSQFSEWLATMGAPPLVANGAVFWVLTLLGAIGVYISTLGFEPKGARAHEPTPRLGAEFRALIGLIAQVLRYAREQPRFGMLLILSCAFRANLVVVFTFLSLWVVSGARLAGIDSAAARPTIGALIIVLQVSNLFATLIAGYVADRTDRSKMLLFALALGGASFLSPLAVHDVFGWLIYVAIGLIGLSEGVSAMATQALLGEQTPAHLRGSATGAFTVVGMLGAMCVNAIGGLLFDKVSFVSPFVMVGVINIICLVVCTLPGKMSFVGPARAADAG